MCAAGQAFPELPAGLAIGYQNLLFGYFAAGAILICYNKAGPYDDLRVCVSVRRFLNRLLGLPVARQNLLFSYFASTLAAEVSAAKAEGRFFEGFSDLGGSLYGGEKPKPQVVLPYSIPFTRTHCQNVPRATVSLMVSQQCPEA